MKWQALGFVFYGTFYTHFGYFSRVTVFFGAFGDDEVCLSLVQLATRQEAQLHIGTARQSKSRGFWLALKLHSLNILKPNLSYLRILMHLSVLDHVVRFLQLLVHMIRKFNQKNRLVIFILRAPLYSLR